MKCTFCSKVFNKQQTITCAKCYICKKSFCDYICLLVHITTSDCENRYFKSTKDSIVKLAAKDLKKEEKAKALLKEGIL